MFGYTRPFRLDLTLRDNIHYRAHYCGLCFALSQQFGLPWRSCTNYDSTLLLLLMSAQLPEPPALARIFCPLGSYRRYCIVDSHQLFMPLSAAFTVLMVDLKSKDSARDGSRLARPARFLANGTFIRAQELLADNSFDTSSLTKIQEHQDELEQTAKERPFSVSFDELTHPSGEGLAHVFEYTALLCGLPDNALPLRRIGNALGKMIYTADCLEDLESDISRQRFNGLVASSLTKSGSCTLTDQALEGLEYLFKRCQAEIDYALKELEILRYRSIIENILQASLMLRISKLLDAHREQSETRARTVIGCEDRISRTHHGQRRT